MAIYVIDVAASPPIIVVVTDDTKVAADVARKYADQTRGDVHIVAGTPTVVAPTPVKRVPITDQAIANAMNVLVEPHPDPEPAPDPNIIAPE